MRLIHTADWHLGRLLHNVRLTRDQETVLTQLIDLVADVRPAAVLLAGDIYDRAVPPPRPSSCSTTSSASSCSASTSPW